VDALLKHCPAGIVLFDLQGTRIECNERFAEIFHVGHDELVPGREWLALLPSAWRSRGIRAWSRVKDTASFNGHDAEVRFVGGAARILVASGRICEKCADGNRVFLVAVQDVTAWKRRADRLRSRLGTNKSRLQLLLAQVDGMREQVEASRKEVSRLQESLKKMSEVTNILMADFQRQKKDIEELIVSNFQITALPLLNELRSTGLSGSQQHLLEILEFSIRHITSYFGINLGKPGPRLSRREIDICRMISDGKDSREIAAATGLAYQTVIVHRKNIRKKLGIKKSKQNLAAFIRHSLWQPGPRE